MDEEEAMIEENPEDNHLDESFVVVQRIVPDSTTTSHCQVSAGIV